MNTLDNSRIPRHIAIIMDGNGRWAKARGMERSMGHQEGAQTVRDITEAASKLGVKYLTLYTFAGDFLSLCAKPCRAVNKTRLPTLA